MTNNKVIPEAAVEAAAKAIHRYDWTAGLSSTFAPTKHHREEARLALEAAAPHMASNDEVKLAAIIVALDQFEKVTKWMETSDETGEWADEAIGRIRAILDGPK